MPRADVVNVAEAKKSLSELLGRVAYGKESITIARRGRPMAKLVPANDDTRASLAEVKGWLPADAPFFRVIGEVLRQRHRRRPRRTKKAPG